LRKATKRRNALSWAEKKCPSDSNKRYVALGGKIDGMAKLTLVYGMRLLPSEEIEEVGEAQVKLRNGREASVALHIVEGSKDEIEKQLRTSIDAFFDLYPEI
jgi:hypothetical protein